MSLYCNCLRRCSLRLRATAFVSRTLRFGTLGLGRVGLGRVGLSRVGLLRFRLWLRLSEG